MKCADCKRELQVGDRYIKFTATEWAEREGEPLPEGMDDIFAQIMGSEHGDYMVFCQDCTVKVDDGWREEYVYGDEEPDVEAGLRDIERFLAEEGRHE